MGKRDRLRRERFFAAHPNCCFCGGTVPATEIDHIPARHLFRARQWPEGYEFPACSECNRASALDELVMGWIVRIQLDEYGALDEREMSVALAKLHSRRPEWIEMMTEYTRVETRRALREAGLSDVRFPSGEVYMMSVPEPFCEAMTRYAEKLGRALYYMHRGVAVPGNGHVRVAALTNAQFMSQSFPREQFDILNVRPAISRSGDDLSDQFAYRYAVPIDGGGAAFLVQFRESTAFLILVYDDKARFEAAVQRRNASSGEAEPARQLLPIALPPQLL